VGHPRRPKLGLGKSLPGLPLRTFGGRGRPPHNIKLREHFVGVNRDEGSASGGQNFVLLIFYLGLVDVLSSFDADFAGFDAEWLVQWHGLAIVDGHLDGHGHYLADFVYLAHGFVEDGRDDATVAVSGRSGVALVEAETGDVAVELFVVGEAQAHAVGIVLSAGEAVVLLEADIDGAVSATGRGFPGGHSGRFYPYDNSLREDAGSYVVI
jgi:hypothetical protein